MLLRPALLHICRSSFWSMSSDRRPEPVSVLLLGSGWTSKFLVPLLEKKQITYAQTRRSPQAEQGSRTIAFSLDDTSVEPTSLRHLPAAELVVIIFPLKRALIRRLIEAYESATGCHPAWLALGSTSAWSKGVASSDTPISNRTNERALAEEELLSLATDERRVAVLNLAGLYGGERNPVNFAKRACDSLEKVKVKTSLHLVHGDDVARAIVGIWEALSDADRAQTVWNRRWLVTDGHVYDWWQLLSTLQPNPIPEGRSWVTDLMKQHSITSLPRAWPTEDNDQPPLVLERALDSASFWKAIAAAPSIGRCDDYGPHGGGSRL